MPQYVGSAPSRLIMHIMSSSFIKHRQKSSQQCPRLPILLPTYSTRSDMNLKKQGGFVIATSMKFEVSINSMTTSENQELVLVIQPGRFILVRVFFESTTSMATLQAQQERRSGSLAHQTRRRSFSPGSNFGTTKLFGGNLRNGFDFISWRC